MQRELAHEHSDVEQRSDPGQIPEDPADRRAGRIRLTERGWAMYELGSKLSRRVGRRWSEMVGDDRFAEFEAVLRDIVATQAQHTT